MNTPIFRGLAAVIASAFMLVTSPSAASRNTDLPDRQAKTSNSVSDRKAEPGEKVISGTPDLPVSGDSLSGTTAVLSAPATTFSLSGEQAGWQVLSMGGTSGSSPSYRLQGTVGQLAIGSGSTGGTLLNQGFWQGLGAPLGCCGMYTGGLTGNTDCDVQGLRNLADVTRLIDRVYLAATRSPLCCEENGNVDGDLAGRLNLSDITRLIDHVFVSHRETAPCL